MDVTLVQAWGNWAAGKPVTHAQLWGVSILWWGRIGKLIELAAGLTIVAEIVGPERLRSIGQSLHHRFEARSAVSFAVDSFRWLAAMAEYAVAKRGSAKEKQAPDRAADEFAGGSLLMINFAVCAVVTVTPLGVLRDSWSFKTFALAVPAYCFALLTVSPVVTVCLIVLVITLGLLVDMLFFEPVAWVLDRDAVERWIKVTSVLLLLVGFHFDLLAS